MERPKDVQRRGATRILRHMNSTLHYGLQYVLGDYFKVIAYINLDWASCIDEINPQQVTYSVQYQELIKWIGKKQSAYVLSSTKS
jgi:hypothetical protein